MTDSAKEKATILAEKMATLRQRKIATDKKTKEKWADNLSVLII